MSENKNDTGYASLTGFKRAVPIILLALAAFIAICFITKENGATGALGNVISELLLGLFAKGAYAIPALLALHAVFYAADVAGGRTLSRLIFSVTALVSLSAVLYTVSNFQGELIFNAKAYYADGARGIGGGFIGNTVAFAIIKIFGHVGLIIVAAVIIALYVSFFFAKGRGAAKKSFYGALLAFAKFGARVEKRLCGAFSKFKLRKSKKPNRLTQQHTDELFDDEYFAVDNGMKELSISALGIHERRSNQSLEENPTLQDKVHHKSAEEKFAQSNFNSESLESDYTARGGAFTANDFSAGFGKESVDSATAGGSRSDTASERAKYGLDCNADEIFTKDFSPIDFALDSSEANRPSSKRASESTVKENSEIKERLHSISEKDIEMARRKADFDMKKKAAFDAMRAQKPYNDTPYEKESYNRAQEFINGVNRDYTQSVPMPEHHQSTERTEYDSLASRQADEITLDIKPESTADFNREADGFTEESRTAEENVGFNFTPFSESTPKKEEIFSFDNVEKSPTYDNRIFETEEKSISEYDLSEEPTADTEFGAEEKDEVITLGRVMLSPTPDTLNDCEAADATEEEKTEADERLDCVVEDGNIEIDIPEEEAPAPERKEEVSGGRLYTYSDDLGNEEKTAPPEKKPTEINDGPRKKGPDYSTYKFPSLDILGKSDTTCNDTLTEEMEENGNKIIETLASFNVLASIKGYDRGPRITRYEVVPAKGVRVNQVVNLFDDIALSLAAEGIRIEAPIPGKSAIGFELPNKTPETVRLRDLLETEEFKNAPSKTLACIGKDVTGSPVFGDIAKMPHVLIAGATGMGKSVCINSILISILYKARPDEVKFILIDPKKVEFKMYNGIPHLLVPVVSDAKQAAGALMWAVEEMERRYDAIENQNVRNIEGYNEKVRANPKLGEPMPKLIIVIDELNDLMLQVRDPVEGLIMSIAQKARAAGIHLIIGTQRPSVNVITGVIKANIPSRMSCKVASYTDSKTIIERAGAERLLDKGDMLYHPVGTPKPLRVQSAFVSDPEVYAVMDALKENKDLVSYDDKVMEDITRAAQKCVKSKGGTDERDTDGDTQDAASYMRDKQFLDAVDIAVSSGKISTSQIQRRIGVGYGKAAKFIDIMESLGIVSEPNGQKPRDALISKDDWLEKLANY